MLQQGGWAKGKNCGWESELCRQVFCESAAVAGVTTIPILDYFFTTMMLVSLVRKEEQIPVLLPMRWMLIYTKGELTSDATKKCLGDVLRTKNCILVTAYQRYDMMRWNPNSYPKGSFLSLGNKK